jgi:sugar phosphate isomerase/epimerase
MKIGVCAWSFTGVHGQIEAGPDPHTPAGLVDLAIRHGLHSIEGASGWWDPQDKASLGDFRQRLADTQLGVFVDTGGHDYAENIQPLRDAIRVAGAVGSRIVRTTISRFLEGDRRSLGADGWQAHLQGLVAPLASVMQEAESAGIDVGIENHQDICSHELVWLCDQVGSPRLGVTMDVGNAYAVGETPLAFARRVLPILKHVHLKDYTVHGSDAGFRLKRCTLGDGVVNWPEMLELFSKHAPQVEGCIELGATQARHIRLFEADWWSTYPERPFVPDAIDALGDLHRANTPNVDWRTPHETDADETTRAQYEMQQFESSISYLQEISAL